MSKKYAGFISQSLGLSKHLGVGINILINVSRHMASLRMEKNHVYINGLIVL